MALSAGALGLLGWRFFLFFSNWLSLLSTLLLFILILFLGSRCLILSFNQFRIVNLVKLLSLLGLALAALHFNTCRKLHLLAGSLLLGRSSLGELCGGLGGDGVDGDLHVVAEALVDPESVVDDLEEVSNEDLLAFD